MEKVPHCVLLIYIILIRVASAYMESHNIVHYFLSNTHVHALNVKLIMGLVVLIRIYLIIFEVVLCAEP